MISDFRFLKIDSEDDFFFERIKFFASFHMTNKSLQLFEFRRFTRNERLNFRNDVRNSFVRLEKRLMHRSLLSLSAPDKFDFFGVAGWLAAALVS